jgi:uncharacterized protein
MSDDDDRRTVRWQRLDRTGTERATLLPSKGKWNVDGRIETEVDGEAARLRYHVTCDGTWRTQVAWTSIKTATSRHRLGLFVTEDGRWIVNRKEQANLRNCVDIDIEMSPATNTLPIRRLAPKVGEARDIKVAWVRFPSLLVQPARQRYTRVAPRRYRFESPDTGFSVEILVDDAGLVIDYPGFWRRAPNP